MDWLTDLPASRGGKDAVMVVVDRFSKMVLLIPCCMEDTVAKTAQRFLKQVVRRFGLPKGLISDRDPKLVSEFWMGLMEQLGTKLDMTTTAHQQANGQAEGQMKQIAAVLRSLPVGVRHLWLDLLPHIEFGLNSAVHRSTGQSPFMIMHGFLPAAPVDLLLPKAEAPAPSVKAALADLQHLRSTVKELLHKVQLEQQHQYNKRHRPAPIYEPGTVVYVQTADLPSTNRFEKDLPKKLRSVWSGPHVVLEKLPRDNYKLLLPADMHMHPVVHASKLKAAKISSVYNRTELHSPPAFDLETQGAHAEVEAVLRHRYVRGNARRPAEFYIKWLDSDSAHGSWRRYGDLQACLPLVDAYMHKHGFHAELERMRSQHSASLGRGAAPRSKATRPTSTSRGLQGL
jgi:hypothetical protein